MSNNNDFSFELVLAERDYLGNPTGRMKPAFSTDKVDQLSEHYYKNSGHRKRKKKKNKSNTNNNPTTNSPTNSPTNNSTK